MSRIQDLREIIALHGVDGYIIPSTDEWRNEYTPQYTKRLEYVSGFSGSNGTLFVTKNDLILFTDSRYTVQAKQELDEEYHVIDMHNADAYSIMKLCKGCNIGYDPMILTSREVGLYNKLGSEHGFTLTPISLNPVDVLREDEELKIVQLVDYDIARTISEHVPSKSDKTLYFAARIKNEYVGVLCLDCKNPNNAHISFSHTKPGYDDVNVQLVRAAEKFAFKEGFSAVTAPSDQQNHNYYESFKSFTVGSESILVKDRSAKKQIHRPKSEVIPLPIEVTGQSTQDKIDALVQSIKSECDYIIITSPASICWLLNIRGCDIEYNPVPLCYALFSMHSREVQLFINLKNDVKFEYGSIIVKPIDSFTETLVGLKDSCFALDRDNTSIWFTSNLQKTIHLPDPILALRAIKNPVEIEGFRQAHIFDGVALCKFWFWLYRTLKICEKVDELSAAKKLHDFRSENESFVGDSFQTISAYGPSGAIIHYNPKPETARPMPSQGCEYIYLLDSGGQYSCAGTTDVTRVFNIGKVLGINKYELKRVYTSVLRGHIALANAVFPIGATGSQLDSIARVPMWQNSLDYGHSTGHGVGHFLSVHEGPHAIARSNNVPLKENMIVSIEPGYYKEGSFGMRIENLYLIKRSNKAEGSLEFELLTMMPIETSLIDFELMSDDEIVWLEKHNTTTTEAVSEHISRDNLEFVLAYTKVR